MNYKEQIKSPKWQKRRLEIMQKDNFTCQLCGDTETMLNVHHLCYHTDKNIWEYEDWELITLCENCHKYEHSSMDCLIETIESIESRGITMREILSVVESIDISLFIGDDEVINRIVGDNSGMGRENDIKLLTERRKLLKASFYKKKEDENKNKMKRNTH